MQHPEIATVRSVVRRYCSALVYPQSTFDWTRISFRAVWCFDLVMSRWYNIWSKANLDLWSKEKQTDHTWFGGLLIISPPENTLLLCKSYIILYLIQGGHNPVWNVDCFTTDTGPIMNECLRNFRSEIFPQILPSLENRSTIRVKAGQNIVATLCVVNCIGRSSRRPKCGYDPDLWPFESLHFCKKTISPLESCKQHKRTLLVDWRIGQLTVF